MGNLLSFVRNLGDSGIKEIDDKFGLFIDFEKENVETEDEAKVYDLYRRFPLSWTYFLPLIIPCRVDAKINESSTLLKFLCSYGPGSSPPSPSPLLPCRRPEDHPGGRQEARGPSDTGGGLGQDAASGQKPHRVEGSLL